MDLKSVKGFIAEVKSKLFLIVIFKLKLKKEIAKVIGIVPVLFVLTFTSVS
jgi:hypothetical protein